VPANQVEGYNQADWILIDYVDFVVHVFSEASRKFYDLERLWKSARKVTVADLRKPAAGPRVVKSARSKAPAKVASRTRNSPGRKPARVSAPRRKSS